MSSCSNRVNNFSRTSCHVVSSDANHTLPSASVKLKQANRRLGVERVRGQQAQLGSVVLFAVWFIAQNTIDLVYNGRGQFWKNLYRSDILH